MIRAILAFFLVVLLFDTAFAGFFPKSFEGEFVQIKKRLNSKKEKKSIAKFKYQFKSNLRLEVYPMKGKTAEDVYVCNSTTVWHYVPPFLDGAKGIVNVGKSSKYCYSKLFDVLKHGLVNNKSYSVKKLSGINYEVTFLKAVAKQLPFKKVGLLFADEKNLTFANINQISLYQSSSENPVRLVKKSLTANKKFKKDTFNFKIPKNTTVEQM